MDNANYVHFGKRPSQALTLDVVKPEKKKITIRCNYKQCLKNHAAGIGGNATDGCGEFMPGGDEGTLESLKCSACNCHRNFHRKVIESDDQEQCFSSQNHFLKVLPVADQAKPILGQYLVSPKKSGSCAYDDHTCKKVRKRFRTKFNQEQKEKMLRFAEKAGWRIQKLDESLVQQFCQEIGIKRRVLRVWMHNNKNTFAKRHFISITSPLEAT